MQTGSWPFHWSRGKGTIIKSSESLNNYMIVAINYLQGERKMHFLLQLSKCFIFQFAPFKGT